MKSLRFTLRVWRGSLARLARRLACSVRGKCDHKYCARPAHRYGLCRLHWGWCVWNTVQLLEGEK